METHLLHWQPEPKPQFFSWRVAALLCVLLILLGTFTAWLLFLPTDHIARGVVIHQHSVGRFTLAQASKTLTNESIPSTTVRVKSSHELGAGEWATASAQLGLHWNIDTALQEAMTIGRRGPWWQQAWERVSGVWQSRSVTLGLSYDETLLQKWIDSIETTVSVQGERPQASFVGGRIVIAEGKRGQKLNRTQLLQTLQSSAGTDTTVETEVEITHVPLSADGLVFSENRLEALRTTTLQLIASDREAPISLTPTQYFPWLQLPDGYSQPDMHAGLKKLVESWERASINAEFVYDAATQKVTTFVPHQNGRQVPIELLAQRVQASLQQKFTDPGNAEWSNKIAVPFEESKPDVTLEQTNTLGLKELIGYGVSRYQGSIPGRVHNVGLTSERVNLTLVQPGSEFSFNAALGEVSRATGFQTAYVIRNGRTELGDGGGVCQVSTTVFRAALNAGLPITQWKPHSYRVGYYEQDSQPGFDATVYAPTADLKFRNDTTHAVLIRTVVDTGNRFLSVELWGTKDGRVVSVSDYKISNQSPPPPTQYQEDPSLPAGVRKQIDWSAPGARTQFQYTVTNADGTTRFAREFVSNFKPWRAVFLVGTGR